MLELAKKKQVYDVLEHISIQKFLSQSQKKYDLIISTDVFIYVGDLRDSFKGIKKMLNRNGLLAFTTEIFNGSGFRLEKSGRFSHSHAYICDLIEKFNFRIENFEIRNLRKENKKWISGGYYVLKQKNFQ